MRKFWNFLWLFIKSRKFVAVIDLVKKIVKKKIKMHIVRHFSPCEGEEGRKTERKKKERETVSIVLAVINFCMSHLFSGNELIYKTNYNYA